MVADKRGHTSHRQHLHPADAEGRQDDSIGLLVDIAVAVDSRPVEIHLVEVESKDLEQVENKLALARKQAERIEVHSHLLECHIEEAVHRS